MTIRLPIVPAIAALSAALLLSSCGKQEAVGDVPSGEELARQADEASAAIRDEAAEAAKAGEEADVAPQEIVLTSYNNTLRGYTIMVPEGWAVDEAASDDNGQTVNAEEGGGSLTVGWTENRENADMTAAIAAIDAVGDAMTGDKVSDDEYRASGTQDDQKTMLRILRKPDESMVQVRMSYPVESAAQMDTIAGQIIDSLALR